MITHDIGSNRFWGFDKVIDTPWKFRTTVHEGDYPYRACDDALVIRILPKTALVTGVWKAPAKNITQHLMEALKGRTLEAIETQEAT